MQLLKIFPFKKKIFLFGMALFLMFSSTLEVFGVGTIFPFMAVVSDASIIEINTYLRFAYDYFNFQDHRSFLLFSGSLVLFFIFLSSLTSFLSNVLLMVYITKIDADRPRQLLLKFVQ